MNENTHSISDNYKLVTIMFLGRKLLVKYLNMLFNY